MDNTNYEAGFRIERDSGSGFEEIGTVGSDVTEYTDTGLIVGQSYAYRVAAFSGTIQSYYSATATATVIKFMVDYDGNAYPTIQIGDQVWMAENLRVTHYRDGTPIPNVPADEAWAKTSSGAYCYSNNDAENAETYGALYNWFAVVDSGHIGPAGWHVPTDVEWKELEMVLGMSPGEADGWGWRGTNEGSQLAGNAALWADGILVNDTAFGSSGFTALPAGYRNFYSGYIHNVGNYAYFWSASESSSSNAWSRVLYYDYSGVYRYSSNRQSGFAVRLLRD